MLSFRNLSIREKDVTPCYCQRVSSSTAEDVGRSQPGNRLRNLTVMCSMSSLSMRMRMTTYRNFLMQAFPGRNLSRPVMYVYTAICPSCTARIPKRCAIELKDFKWPIKAPARSSNWDVLVGLRHFWAYENVRLISWSWSSSSRAQPQTWNIHYYSLMSHSLSLLFINVTWRGLAQTTSRSINWRIYIYIRVFTFANVHMQS